MVRARARSAACSRAAGWGLGGRRVGWAVVVGGGRRRRCRASRLDVGRRRVGPRPRRPRAACSCLVGLGELGVDGGALVAELGEGVGLGLAILFQETLLAAQVVGGVPELGVDLLVARVHLVDELGRGATRRGSRCR